MKGSNRIVRAMFCDPSRTSILSVRIFTAGTQSSQYNSLPVFSLASPRSPNPNYLRQKWDSCVVDFSYDNEGRIRRKITAGRRATKRRIIDRNARERWQKMILNIESYQRRWERKLAAREPHVALATNLRDLQHGLETSQYQVNIHFLLLKERTLIYISCLKINNGKKNI